MTKLETLCDEYGYDDELDMAQDYEADSIIPGICMNEGCGSTFEYEPDSSDGWCDNCETNTVKSLFVLMGVM